LSVWRGVRLLLVRKERTQPVGRELKRGYGRAVNSQTVFTGICVRTEVDEVVVVEGKKESLEARGD